MLKFGPVTPADEKTSLGAVTGGSSFKPVKTFFRNTGMSEALLKAGIPIPRDRSGHSVHVVKDFGVMLHVRNRNDGANMRDSVRVAL